MDCCEKITPDFIGEPEVASAIGRRTALRRLAGLAGELGVDERRAAVRDRVAEHGVAIGPGAH